MATSKGVLPGYTGKKGEAALNLGWWSEQIRAGIAWRDKWTLRDKWETWDQYYRGDYPVAGSRLQLQDVMPVNLFYIMARSFVPRIYFRNPSVSVTARKPGPEQLGLATLHERLYNKVMRQMKMKEAMRKITNKVFFRGSGFGKLGYGALFAPPPHAAEAAESSAIKGATLEYSAGLDPSMPWFEPVETEHYVLPAGTVDKNKAPWEVHIIFRDTDELRLDPRMKNTKDLGPTYDVAGVPGEPRLTETWEVHDRRTGLAFIMTPDGHQHTQACLLGPVSDTLQTANGGPVHGAVFNENLGTYWGLPDGQVLEPLQNEINEISTQIMYHRRLSIIKFIADANSIKPEQAAALLTEMDIGAILYGLDGKSSIEAIKVGSIPPELFQAYDRVMEIVRLTFGFSRNQFGEFQPGSEKPTAREAHAVQQASALRVDERRDIMADFLTETLEDVGKLLHEHWSEERVEQVVGPFGVPIWVRFSGAMLKNARFELSVDPDSTLPETKETREQKAQALFQALYPLTQVPDAQTGAPLINSVKLTRFLVNELQGVATDELILGVPNIYDENFVRALMGNTNGMREPVSPGQLGHMFQQAGPASTALQSAFPGPFKQPGGEA